VAQTDLLAISSRRMLLLDHADQVVLLDTPIARERTTTILTRAGDVLPTVAKDVIAAFGEQLGLETMPDPE
jgi:hypothetical protein